MARLRPQPQTQIEPRLRAAEAAALLGVSPRLVQALCARGELGAIRVGRLWTTTESALSRYLATRAAHPLPRNTPTNAPERVPDAPATDRAAPPAPRLSATPTRSRFESLLRRRS